MLDRLAKKIILFPIGFSFSFLFSQNNQIDSLSTILKTTEDDTSKVNILITISKKLHQTGNFMEAVVYAEDALSLARKVSYKKGMANAYNSLGVSYFYEAKYSDALNNYTAALKIREEAGDNQAAASSYHNIALVYHNQGNYPEALKNYLASLKIYEKIAEKESLAKSYGNIALIYWEQLHYSEALQNHFKSLELFKELKHNKGIAVTQNNIGLVYENQGNYSEALKYYNAALKAYEELGDRPGMIDRYFNIGFLYQDQGNYSEALKNHQAALKISEETGIKGGVAAAYANIGEIYSLKGKVEPEPKQREKLFNVALHNYFTSLETSKEIEDDDGVATCFNSIGGLYYELKNYSKAKQFLNKSLALATKIESISGIKDSHYSLAKLDSATGNWMGAFRNFQSYILYRDSLVNEETTRKTMKAQMQFDFDKKEDSLKYQQDLADAQLSQQILLTRQQKRAKNYLIAGIVLLAVLSFFLYRNYLTRQQLKLQTLRNKIASDLHDDVGSTLSSISIFSQMAHQQSKETIPLLESIGESSRKMLDAMADIVWTINPENDQFEKIISRMKNFAYEILGAKKIDFEFVADDEVTNMKLPMEVRKNLYLIFKEATNNMVKYAEASKAMFAINGGKNDLTMMIRDNGRGFDANKSSEGNGLKNMKKRAEEIGGQLMIESYPGNGTTIQLNVAV